MPNIDQAFIDKYVDCVTDALCERHNVDPNDSKARAILAYNILNPDSPIKERNVINDYLDYIMITLITELHSNIVLKGGYLLEQLLPNTARQSQDVDFSIEDPKLYEDIKVLLVQIAKHFIEEGVIHHYTLKDEIKPFMSGGIDMYDNTNQKILGVDIGLHEISYGINNTTINNITTSIFSIERILGDKLTAILSRKRFRRPKDLYDFFIVTDNFDFDVLELSYCIQKRLTLDELFSTLPFSDTVLFEYRKAYNSLKLQSITNKRLAPVDYTKAINRVNAVVIALIQYPNTTWSHTRGTFI